MRKPAFDRTHSTPLRLTLDNTGAHILTGTLCGLDVTLSFADTEPVRNVKDACLAIITDQYADHVTGNTRKPA